MSARTFRSVMAMGSRCLPFAVALACGAAAEAAQPATPSVLTLFNRIPELPSTADEAAKWVDHSGKLIHPGMLKLKADIEAHKKAMEEVVKPNAARGQVEAANRVEDLGKGMADVGIDMARMQSDPAYARDVQEKMRKMSPDELMAMSQKMSRPMNRDTRLQNQAQLMVNDPPAVQAAAEAGYAYANGQPARMQAYQTSWREADQAIQKVNAKPYPAIATRKPGIEWDSPGCDNGCVAAWDAYATQLLPLMLARDTEILQLRRASLQRQRAAVTEGIKTADKHLLATQYGAAAQSQVNQSRILGYDVAALSEIILIIDRMEDSVTSAAVLVHCGKQAVWAPGTVCSN